MRWMDKHVVRTLLEVKKTNRRSPCSCSKSQKQPYRKGPVREIEIETEAAKKIEEEIRGLFEKGLKLGADTLQLGHTLYRKHPHEWHRLQKNSALPLRPDMLESVNVQVHINDGGISKVKQKP